tara:strand:+ start:356 stop:2302 length:1947 start_codon:yes stop_codon:yes gene_type:complete
MANTSNVIQFIVKGGKAAARKIKMQADAMRGYVKQLKIFDKEGLVAFERNRNLSGSFSVLRSKLLLVSFATGMVAKTIGKYVKVAADAQEITNKFNVVFGASSKKAHEFAEALSNATGRSSTKLREMLASLQDTFVPLGFAREESAKLAKSLTRLSLDVASFNNATDVNVMKAFQSAIVGNHEAVRSFGIVLTESALKQKAVSMGIASSNRELTAQEKVMARVKLIYDSTTDAQGDLARTQDSYTNQLKAFNDQIFELQRTIGEKLMPLGANFLSLSKRFADTAHISALITVLGVLATAYATAAIKAGVLTKAVITQNKVVKRSGLLFAALVAIEVVSWMFDIIEKNKKVKQSFEDVNDTVDVTAGLFGKTLKLSTEGNTKTLEAYKDGLEDAEFHIFDLNEMIIEHTNLRNQVAGLLPGEAQAQQEIIDKMQAQLEFYKNVKADAEYYITILGHVNKSTIDINKGLGDLLEKQEIVAPSFEKTAVSLDFLDDTQKGIVDGFSSMSNAMASAIVNGQKMGDAIVSSLKAIAVEMIANAAVFSLLQMFTGGTFGAASGASGSLGKILFGGFAATGMNKVVTQPTMIVAGEAGAEKVNITPLTGASARQTSEGGGVTVNITGGVVDQDYVRNELIPALNRATGTGSIINA